MNAPQMLGWSQAVDSWSAHERAAIVMAVDSGRLTMGNRVKEFEARFAEYVGTRNAVMVNSGSSANLIAVATMFHAGRIKRGDQVIVPALAWATTYAPLQQHGLRLRVVDIDPATLNVDAALVLDALNQNTRLIVAVNVLGNPCCTGILRGIDFVPLLEDNCESMGARIGARYAGTFGHIGTFSFFFSHHLNTIEGGMLATDDDELADIARCLRAHGWTRDLRADSKLRSPRSSFERDYDFALPGYNVRPTEIPAAAGLEQLKHLDDMAVARRRNAGYLTQVLEGTPWTTQRLEDGAVPFALTLISKEPGLRQRLVERLYAMGAECRPIAGGCFSRQRAAAHYDWEAVGSLQNAEYVNDNGLMLGNHPVDMRGQIDMLRELLLN